MSRRLSTLIAVLAVVVLLGRVSRGAAPMGRILATLCLIVGMWGVAGLLRARSGRR